jgi:hypothetical protein
MDRHSRRSNPGRSAEAPAKRPGEINPTHGTSREKFLRHLLGRGSTSLAADCVTFFPENDRRMEKPRGAGSAFKYDNKFSKYKIF